MRCAEVCGCKGSATFKLLNCLCTSLRVQVQTDDRNGLIDPRTTFRALDDIGPVRLEGMLKGLSCKSALLPTRLTPKMSGMPGRGICCSCAEAVRCVLLRAITNGRVRHLSVPSTSEQSCYLLQALPSLQAAAALIVSAISSPGSLLGAADGIQAKLTDL